MKAGISLSADAHCHTTQFVCGTFISWTL